MHYATRLWPYYLSHDIEQDESEEIEIQNIGPQGLADEGERIHSIVDEMEAEDHAAMEMEEHEVLQVVEYDWTNLRFAGQVLEAMVWGA